VNPIKVSVRVRKQGALNDKKTETRRRDMPELSSHRIFKFDDDEIPIIKDLEQGRRNVVAFKGTEVYVAVGSAVRYAELREWYAMEDVSEDEKYYQVPTSLALSLTLDVGFPFGDIRHT
jgi:hypothetical protein